MKTKLTGNASGRQPAMVLGCGLTLLLLTGCSAAPSAEAQLFDTGLSTDASPAVTLPAPVNPVETLPAPVNPVETLPAPVNTPVSTLPAPVNPGGNPDTQPISPTTKPDTQPATVPGAKYQTVTCGTATMDLPAGMSIVKQYGTTDITTDYATSDGKTKVELTCRDRKATDDPNTDFQNTKNALSKAPEYTYNKNNRWVLTGPGLLCNGNCEGTPTSEYYIATWYSNSKVFSMLWEYPTTDHSTVSPEINHVYYSFKWNGGTSAPVTPGQTQQPVAPTTPSTGNTATTKIQLALREGPECSSARLNWIPKGTTVKVERGAVDDQSGWYLVDYNGQVGWASGYYLEGSSITYAGPKLCEN